MHESIAAEITSLDRLPYERPLLEPLTFTTVSKHLAADVSANGQLEEPFSAEALLGAYGSPLFVVSERALRRLYRDFRQAFTEVGIETRVAYSYKTNYLPAICSILHEEGAWAEIVSGMEYELARGLGVPPRDIIFNGPYKARDELHKALAEGALVNIDNFDELEQVEHIARELKCDARIGMRVNFRRGPASWTKFGFSYDDGATRHALERIAERPKLRLEMLHNHGGTFVLDPALYGEATEVLIDVARSARTLGLTPTRIDLGGGYPSHNRLKPALDVPGGRREYRVSPYAEAIFSRLAKAGNAFGEQPTLVLEPGRALVDAAVYLLARVVALKTIAGQGKAVVVDAGVNLIPTAYWYDHGVQIASEDDEAHGELDRVNVYGPLCMQIDVLREGALLPPLELGTPLVFSNVGAYCQTQSVQFIQPRPATVLLAPDGPELIRRRETWRDVFGLDEVPERLRRHGFSL
jgi:diaminopimelate decarboxylase